MNVLKSIPQVIHFFPPLASGLLLTLCFPDTQWSLLAWIALVPLLVSIRNTPPNRAFKMGLTMGMAHFFPLIYWILPTLRMYGNLPVFLAFPVLFLLVCYLALYPAVFCLILSWKSRQKGFSPFMPLVASFVWVGLEFIRTRLFTGFPWGLTGYSQYMQTSLIQIADVTGVYGISFVIILVNATLATAWHHLKTPKHAPEKPRLQTASLIAWPILVIIILTGMIAYGHARLSTMEKEMALAPQRMISVIQGNIAQSEKWDDAYKKETVDIYCRLSRKAAEAHPTDLIIWPETALPFYYTWEKEISDEVNTCIRQSKAWFIIGSPAFSLRGEDDFQFFNRAYMLTPRAEISSVYDKIHLVPFGEYVPFGNYLTFLDKLTSQAGDFSPGIKNAPPLAFKENQAGILICFEIIFPQLASTVVKNGADLLVTMTNDAWFGRTSAPLQHFSMAVFRAVENRRSVARSANTGISGFIDPGGKINETTSLFEETALTRQVACLTSMSFYTRHGDVFAELCLLATLVFLVVPLGGKKISESNA